MKISQNCLDIIKKWEGLELEAYLDPVGIPTIGYGTIRYPNGQKVKLGEKISQLEAEEFLKFEVDEVAEKLESSLSGISLNQNRFDAIVSLCYNIGVGAFKGSTILKELKKGDFQAASKAFELWNKGTVDGVKKELPGLTNRRRDERALFDKTGAQGKPLEVEEPLKDKVTRLEGFRDETGSVIVARASDDTVAEILVLKNSGIQDFISAIEQYKNAATFEIAPAGKKIPQGKRIETGGKADKPAKNEPAKEPETILLKRGDESDQVKKMQDALVKLGCMTQEQVDTGYGIFGGKTETAVKLFQKNLGFPETGVFSNAEQSAVGGIIAGIGKGNSSAELVKAVQSRLVALNYMTQAQVDTGFGTFGSKTDEAVRKFQKDRLLPESGVIEAVAFRLLFKDFVPSSTNETFAPNDGEHYTIKPNADVFFTKNLEKKVADVAKIYFQKTQKKFVVTSGYRPPAFQAEAMYNKIVNEGESKIRQLYRRSGNTIVQILDSYRNNKNDREKAVQAIRETIEKQLARGIQISNHLLSNAVDIRKTANSKALDEATRAVGGRVVIESDHFHLELT